MILNQAQAEGIYGSMCIANNFGGRVSATISGCTNEPAIKVNSLDDGRIEICGDSNDINVPVPRETYANQAAFAAAYGLQ